MYCAARVTEELEQMNSRYIGTYTDEYRGNLLRACNRQDLQTLRTTSSVHTTSLSEREGLSTHLEMFFTTRDHRVGKLLYLAFFPLFSLNKPCTDAWAGDINHSYVSNCIGTETPWVMFVLNKLLQ